MILKSAVKYRSQKGAVLLLLGLLLLIGSGYTLLVKLNTSTSFIVRQSKETQESLRLAKQALIAYAVNFPEIDAASGTDMINGPGYLPCPDINNNGSAGGTCSAAGNTNIGRLPYRTLEVPQLRDSSGARLWYALSDNYRNSTGMEPLNSETPGQLTVDGVSDIVAVIIAPGPPIGNQNRNPADTNILTEITNYIETENNDLDLDFISIDPDKIDFTDFNDRLISITRQELMAQIEKRVLGEARTALTSYKATAGAYPWLSPFADPKAVARKLSGQAAAGSSAILLNDSTNDFSVRGVAIGDEVYNLTDGSIGTVNAVAANALGITGLDFGTDNDFDVNDEYVVISPATPTTLTGTTTSAGDNNTLNDNSRNLNNTGISIGDVIENLTDGSTAIATAVSANSIEVDGLAGGTDNLFQNGDTYFIRNNYGIATNAAPNAIQLDDTNKNFVAMGVQAGDVIRNLTDDSFGSITTVNATSLVVDQLDFGTNNLFSAGDSYSIARFNAISGTREGHLSLHEAGELFPTSFGIDWNVSVLNAGDVVFDTVTFANVEAPYRMAGLYLQNYALSGSVNIDDANAYCVWSVPDIADCYGRFTQNINISGTVTSGSNTNVITDSAADFITDNVKHGDIVQNYDDEYSTGISDDLEGGTRSKARGGTNNLTIDDNRNDFISLGVQVGDTITNITDGSSGTVASFTTETLTASSLTGGTDNVFEDNDIYQIGTEARLYDADTNFNAANIVPYEYLIHNLDTGIRGVITEINSDNTITAVAFDNQPSAMTFTPRDDYEIYTPGIVIVDTVTSATVLNTTRTGVYNPDFDLIGTYPEYYRIIPAGNSLSAQVEWYLDLGAPWYDLLFDTDGDFINEGVAVGDIVEDITDGSYGEITFVGANLITAELYGGATNTFTTGGNYIIYHDYVYSRKHEFHTRFNGNQATNAVSQERVRDVCIGYNAACSATTGAVNFSGNGGVPLIRIRDYEADGTTEVGRADFTPSNLSSGDLRVSNIDYYLNEVTDNIPSWFINNDWHKLIYVAYSAGDAPGAAAACVAGTNCLTINGLDNNDLPVVNSNNNNALVIAAGMEINTTLDNNCNAIAAIAQNRANGTINEYYESNNCSAGDDGFQEQFETNTFNDQLRVVEP